MEVIEAIIEGPIGDRGLPQRITREGMTTIVDLSSIGVFKERDIKLFLSALIINRYIVHVSAGSPIRMRKICFIG
jgi:hypothetical protein